MTALLALLALAATTPGDPRLDVAQPAQVLAAVQDCSRAVTGKTKVDHRALEADGWKQDEKQGIWIYRRKLGTAAIILANSGQSNDFPANPMQEACMVRARLSGAAALEAVADQITTLTRTDSHVSKRKPDNRLWRGTATWIAMEPFDAAADGTPVTQLVVVPTPAWTAWQRGTLDGSSQNKNQEPR